MRLRHSREVGADLDATEGDLAEERLALAELCTCDIAAALPCSASLPLTVHGDPIMVLLWE